MLPSPILQLVARRHEILDPALMNSAQGAQKQADTNFVVVQLLVSFELSLSHHDASKRFISSSHGTLRLTAAKRNTASGSHAGFPRSISQRNQLSSTADIILVYHDDTCIA